MRNAVIDIRFLQNVESICFSYLISEIQEFLTIQKQLFPNSFVLNSSSFHCTAKGLKHTPFILVKPKLFHCSQYKQQVCTSREIIPRTMEPYDLRTVNLQPHRRRTVTGNRQTVSYQLCGRGSARLASWFWFGNVGRAVPDRKRKPSEFRPENLCFNPFHR